MTPEQGNVQPWRENVERVREALVGPYPLKLDAENIALLDALTTQIEELERELQIVNEANAAWGAVAGEFSVRAEKAEQERDALKFEVHGQCIEREKAERALAEAINGRDDLAEHLAYLLEHGHLDETGKRHVAEVLVGHAVAFHLTENCTAPWSGGRTGPGANRMKALKALREWLRKGKT